MSKSVVIFDANNLASRCVHIGDVKHVNPETKEVDYINWEYWRLIMFSNIYQVLYKVPAHTVVLAVDSKNSWRYEVWERYKEARKKKNKDNKDKFPWDEYYTEYDRLLGDIKAHFPVKVLKIERCEADDIIGTISLQTKENVEIISTDKDFLQLSCDRVKIFNPLKKMHVSHPNPKLFLLEECLMGQEKDSIYNIKTPLDHPEGKRKPGFGPKSFEKVMEEGVVEWLNKNDLVQRYRFNKVLMDFKMIPQDIQDTIMSEYNNYKYPSPSMMWEFVKAQEWPELIDRFTQVETKFLELY